MYRAGSISGSRNHPSNLVGNRNKNKRGRLAEDFFFLFDIKTNKKTKVKEKGEICAAKEGRKWMAFFGYQPQGARDSNNGILSCSLVSPSVQSAAIEAIRSLYLHATLRVLMHRNKWRAPKSQSLSLSLASYADGTRARTLTAQQDDLTVTRWIRKGLNVYILCTKREKRWVDQTKRRTISSGYRAIGWTRRNTSDPVPVEDTNLTGSLVSIGASKRVGFPDSRDGKLLIGLSILVFWEE